MASKPKMNIVDDTKWREEIEKNTYLLNQIDLATWAISVAKHVLPYLEKEHPDNENIANGFKVNGLWQKGEATVYQVRQAGFNVHEVARKCQSETAKAAARTVGHAVGVGHMRDHAMVATDYAVKTINLVFNNDMTKVTEEREWQWHELNKVIQESGSNEFNVVPQKGAYSEKNRIVSEAPIKGGDKINNRVNREGGKDNYV